MTRCRRFVIALAVLWARSADAQARVLSAPPEPSLLGITRGWSSASILGDLRELRTSSDYAELRVWGGFALTTATQAVVLRRNDGRWSAFLARVLRCEMLIPRSVGDTASRATMQRFVAETRRHCGSPLVDVGAGAQIITADTLVVDRLSVSDSTIEAAWNAAMSAGAFRLPGRVDHKHVADDAFMYVVEVRRGDDYRASVIEHVDRAESDWDRRMSEIYSAVNRVLPPDQVLKP